MADTEVQTMKSSTSDLGIQVKTKTRTSVTQTAVETAEVEVSVNVETEERGIQPELSMFRLEDIQSKENKTVSYSIKGRLVFFHYRFQLILIS